MGDQTEGNTQEQTPLVEGAAVPQLLPMDMSVEQRTLLAEVVTKTNYSGEHCALVASALAKVVNAEAQVDFNPEEYGIMLWSVNDAQFKGEIVEKVAALKATLAGAIYNPTA